MQSMLSSKSNTTRQAWWISGVWSQRKQSCASYDLPCYEILCKRSITLGNCVPTWFEGQSTVMEASTLIYGHDAKLGMQEFLLAPRRKRVCKGDFTRLFLSFHTCGAERIQAIRKHQWQFFCATSTYWWLVLDFCDFFCRTSSRVGDSRKIWFPMGVFFFSRFSQQGVAKVYLRMNSIPRYVRLKEMQ